LVDRREEREPGARVDVVDLIGEKAPRNCPPHHPLRRALEVSEQPARALAPMRARASRAEDELMDADAVLIEVPGIHKPAPQMHAPNPIRTIPTPIRIVRTNPVLLSLWTLVYSLGGRAFVRK